MDKKTRDAGKHGAVPGSKAAVIAAVQTPLGFFVLVVLLVEVVLGSVAALTAGIDRTYLILGMLALTVRSFSGWFERIGTEPRVGVYR
jgi:hypothetical protein